MNMSIIEAKRPAPNRELITYKTIFSHEEGKGFTAEDIVHELEQQGVKDMTTAQVTKRLSYFARTGKLYEFRGTFMLDLAAFPLL